MHLHRCARTHTRRGGWDRGWKEIEGGWKGLGLPACFLQAAYRAHFCSQHAEALTFSILAPRALPPSTLLPPHLFSLLAPYRFQHQRLSLRPCVRERKRKNPRGLSILLTQPREQMTKLEESREEGKKMIFLLPITFLFFCNPWIVVLPIYLVPSPLSRASFCHSFFIGILHRRRETWKFLSFFRA